MARELAPESTSDAEPGDAATPPVPADDYGQPNGNESLLGRRGYLKLGAAAAAALATGAGANRARAAEPDMSFDRVVHAVDDLGWDPSGNRSIDSSLDNNLVDGTLIEVPPGTYLVRSSHRARNLSNWGIRGLGSDKGDVRFVVPRGRAQRIFNIRGNSRNILVQNLTFDQYDTWETCIGNVFQVADGLLMKDVEYAGRNPSEHTGAVSRLNVYIFDPDGVAVLDGVVLAGPTELVDYPDNPLALFCGTESVGTLYVRNCRFENCGEHAIYASRCEGNVRIENSYFKNNQNTHVRISGEGSWAKNSTFVWDLADHPNKGSFQAMTGLTFEAGFRGYSGGLVEGCDFICRSSGPNSGCLKVDGSHGSVTVRNCRFQIDANAAEPIWADAPGDSHMIDGRPDRPWDLTLENVSITGSGRSERTHTGAIQVAGRDRSVFRNICIDMTGDRDGIVLVDSDGCSIEDANVAVPGNATVFRNASADTTNLTHNGGCPLPSTDFNPGSGTPTSLPHSLSVRGPEGADAFDYEFTVSGDARLVTTGEYAANPRTNGVGEEVVLNLDGTTTVTGRVAGGGGDTFGYSGEILAFAAEGDAILHQNGEAVDPETVGWDHRLVVTTPDGADATDYEFTVDGDVELVTTGEYAANPRTNGVGEEVVENGDGTATVSGRVAGGGGDTFAFDGTLTDFDADGAPVVYVNGEVLDLPGTDPSDPSEPSEPSNTLTVVGPEGADAFDYEFTVDGDVELVTTGEYAANPRTNGVGEEVVENGDGTATVSGRVAGGGGDTFRYSGEILAFAAAGSPLVYINGEEIDYSEFSLPNKLRVVAPEGADAFDYEFTVDGDVELVTTGEYAANPRTNGVGEEIVENDDGTATVSGRVANGGGDTFRYSGEILAFAAEGNAILYRNGERIHPTDFGVSDVLTIAGLGSLTNYEFTVTGGLLPNPDEGSLESEDSISGSSAEGTVADGADSYLFTGHVADFTLDGDAEVLLNGEAIDPESLGLDHELQIVGAGIDTAEYSFAVDGNLVYYGQPPESTDVIDGNTVIGSVMDGVDTYLFSGEITEFSLDGEAGVYLDGDQIDPDRLGGDDDPVLPNWLVFDGTEGTSCEYAFAVTGAIQKSPDLGSVEPEDVIDGTAVTGTVDGDADGFRFSGNITRLLIEGNAAVSFEDMDG